MSLRKIINKYSTIFVILGFLVVNIFFNFNQYWKELFYDSSKSDKIVGEIYATEWGLEKIYEKLIRFENPFSALNEINYPFGIDIIGTDGGTAFVFPLFRFFLSTHQTLSIIIIISIFLSNYGMFLLLRRLKISIFTSFFIGLCYGFMTFSQQRAGHPTYISSLFLLPWGYLFGISFISSSSFLKKSFYTLLISMMFVLALWINMYYFIILCLSALFIFLFFLIKRNKDLVLFITKNIIYIFLFIFSFLILNLPWFYTLYQTAIFSETPISGGWNGAIEFSSDLFGFFIPSIYNFYYGDFVRKLTLRIPFARGIFEQFTYPGLIIIASYLYLMINYKKLSKSFFNKILPYLTTSLGFTILTLGPFLHILGKWYIDLEDKIRLVFPLPFIFLHYLPFLGNIRAPGRLIVGFIFFAYIVAAYLIDFKHKNKFKKHWIFIVLLLLVFFIDNRPSNIVELHKPIIPKKTYSIIKKDKEKFSVLQIPFSIRDGFTYFGDYNSVTMTLGESYYKKPTIGIYSGRVPNYIKEYFRQDPFIGFIGRKIDLNLRTNPYMKNTNIDEWNYIDIEKAKDTINFLSIKYIIVDNKRKMSKVVAIELLNLGYEEIFKEGKYSLWQKQITNQDFIDINILNSDSNRYIGMGWYDPESDFRWSARRSSILFKLKDTQKANLKFSTASFYKDLKLTVYLNKKKVKTFNIGTEPKEYSVVLDRNLKKGINFVYFIFNDGFRPSDVIKDSLDERKLSASFYKIELVK